VVAAGDVAMMQGQDCTLAMVWEAFGNVVLADDDPQVDQTAACLKLLLGDVS